MSAPRLKVEAKAWRIVARALDRDPLAGLNAEVIKALGEDPQREVAMTQRVKEHVGGGFAYQEKTADVAPEAVLFTLLLALECESEAEALRSPSSHGGKR